MWIPGLRLFAFSLMVRLPKGLVTLSFPPKNSLCPPTGGTENVNYAVHVLMALLVQSGMFEEVYCNRLPPG